MFNCPACSFDHTDGVSCANCAVTYCFSCANITESNYRKLGKTKKASLLCPACKNQPQASTASPAMSPQPQPARAEPASSPATLDQVLRELRDGITGINVRLEQLPALVQEVKDIKEQFHVFEDSMTSKTTSMEMRITALESRGGDNNDNYPQFQKKIDELAAELAIKDQRERLNNVEIKGIPFKRNENLIALVCKLGATIGRAVQPAEVNFVTRARSSADPKPIIVGFIGRYTKENFIAAARSHKHLTAEDLGFTDVSSKVYVNDHLTRDNKQLLTKTKKLARDTNYNYVWVQNSKILVRKNDTSPIIHIQGEEHLNKLK